MFVMKQAVNVVLKGVGLSPGVQQVSAGSCVLIGCWQMTIFRKNLYFWMMSHCF